MLKPRQSALSRVLNRIVVSIFFLAVASLAGVVNAAGLSLITDRTFIRSNGKPVTERVSFSSKWPGTLHQVTMWNGGRNGEHCRLSSAVITLNGISILTPNQLNQKVEKVSVNVTLQSLNELSVELRSKPGCALTLGIERLNAAPKFITSPVIQAEALNQYSYAAEAVDPDNDAVHYTLLSGPQGLAVSSGGVLTWLPTQDQVGGHAVTLQTTDQFGASTLQQFIITVTKPANRPPVISSSPVVEALTEIPYQYDVIAADPDQDLLSYRLLTAPTGMAIDSNGQIRWVPGREDVGDHQISVMVSDPAGESAQQQFAVTVKSSNRPPMFTSQPNMLEIGYGETWQYLAKATDPDNEQLSFELVSVPDGVGVNRGSGFYYWHPGKDQLGEHQFVIRVNDHNGGTAEQQFTVTINEAVNHVPVITSAPLTQHVVEQPYSYQVIAEDEDNDVLSFVLIQAPAGMQIDGNTGDITWLPTHEQAGPQLVQVKVLDTKGAGDEQAFMISSAPAQHAPEFTTQPVQAVAATNIYDYDADALDSDQGDVLRYSAYLSPIGLTVDDATGHVRWQPALAMVEQLSDVNPRCVSTQPTVGVFDPVVKWAWKGIEAIKRRDVFGPPAVAQLTDDNADGVINENDNPDLVFGESSTNWLVAIDGMTAKQHWVNKVQYINPLGSVAVADIDKDGIVEIITVDYYRTEIVAFENTGVVKWKSATGPRKADNLDGISIADLDGDGSPEIIHGARVFSADGTLKWAASKDSGGILDSGFISIAADVNLDGQQDVIAGRTVYSYDGSVLWHRADLSSDGFNAVGNFDSDDYPEIVLVHNGKVTLLDQDGKTIWGPVTLPGGGIGGPPTIADFDGDGLPEIGVAGLKLYSVFETNGAVKWSLPVSDYTSSRTGSSVFDFEGDGRAEVLYADEKNFYIINGDTGSVLYSLPNISGTTLEYPIVVDIDKDNQAEIVLASNGGTTAGIRVLESAGGNWVGTRSIWNQHAYSIDNINDDGSVPSKPARGWLTHNSFRLNAYPDRPSRALADLHVGNVQLIEEGGQLHARAVVKNRGLLPVEDIDVRFFFEAPSATSTSFSGQTGLKLAGGEVLTVTSDAIAGEQLGSQLFVVVDPDQKITECEERNNQAGAAVIGLSVSDPSNLSDHQLFSVRVYDANRAPTISSSPEMEAEATKPYRYQIIAADSNIGDGLRYELALAPAGMRIDKETGLVSWQPVAASQGSHSVRVRVVDLAGLVAEQSWQLLVNAYSGPNREPTIKSVPADVAAVDTPYEYQVLAFDEDNDPLVFALGVVPAGMTIDSNGLIRWTPVAAQLGPNMVSIAVGDNKGGVALQNFQIEVFGVVNNSAPAITPSTYSPARVGERWNYQVTASDADGDILLYRLVSAPIGMTIDASTGAMLWYPTATDIGTHNVTVSVTDGRGGSAQAGLTLPVQQTVNLGNQAPIISSTPGSVTDPGQVYVYQIQARDSDGDALTYSLIQGPAGMTINSNSGELRWTPAPNQIGSFLVVIEVRDGRGGSFRQSFTIVVRDLTQPNQPPSITSVAPTQVKLGERYQYTVVAVDPNGDTLTYQLLQAPIGMAIDSTGGGISWVPTSEQVGVHKVVVRAQDSQGGYSEQRFDVFATAPATANRRRCRAEP